MRELKFEGSSSLFKRTSEGFMSDLIISLVDYGWVCGPLSIKKTGRVETLGFSVIKIHNQRSVITKKQHEPEASVAAAKPEQHRKRR